MIKVSAPGKIHLLGEHAVVYGKPALLTTIDLRVSVSVIPSASEGSHPLKKIIEPILKNYFKLKKIPPYKLDVSSQIPIGAGLGSSAAVSSAYIGALLTFLKIKWDKPLLNELAYEAEKVFHGNPSRGDNSTVVYGGLVWFRKETPEVKIIQPLQFTIPSKLAKNFVIINTGKPKESTKEMVEMVSKKYKKFLKIFDHQEQLVRELVAAVKEGNEKEFIRIIKEGEKNLESIGVASKFAQNIIRKIEKADGAAKICGAGGVSGPTGVLLCYHQNKKILAKIASENKLNYFSVKLGVEGIKQE